MSRGLAEIARGLLSDPWVERDLREYVERTLRPDPTRETPFRAEVGAYAVETAQLPDGIRLELSIEVGGTTVAEEMFIPGALQSKRDYADALKKLIYRFRRAAVDRAKELRDAEDADLDAAMDAAGWR